MDKQQQTEDQQLEYLLYAMRLVVEWSDLEAFCLTRSTCKGCPYKKRNLCDRTSTTDVLHRAAELFREFLES